MDYHKQLLHLVDLYCGVSGIGDNRVSKLIFNHGNRIKNIRAGASLTVRSFEFAIGWFSNNWPEDLDWPEDIPRPEVQHDAA